MLFKFLSKTESQYDKRFGKQKYCTCVLLICDGSWSLRFLVEAFEGTYI